MNLIPQLFYNKSTCPEIFLCLLNAFHKLFFPQFMKVVIESEKWMTIFLSKFQSFNDGSPYPHLNHLV